MQVSLNFQAPKKKKVYMPPIIFSNEDSRNVIHPYHDALGISMNIFVKLVSRILIDTESSVDSIFKETFYELKIKGGKLQEVNSPLKGFGGESKWPLGLIAIPVTFGKGSDKIISHTQNTNWGKDRDN